MKTIVSVFDSALYLVDLLLIGPSELYQIATVIGTFSSELS